MKEFKREDRYLVLKISDCNTHLTIDERKTLNLMAAKVGIGRALSNKIDLKCVVVESDWPEYEPTWDAIEIRMLGNPQGVLV